MWPMTFQLPSGVPREVAQQLEWSCLAGGPDNMPLLTQVSLRGDLLGLTRNCEESVYLVAPWPVEGIGQVMGTSATLMARQQPYNLVVELARGKVNQIRGQAADWQAGGLQMPAELTELIRQASHTFGHAVCATGDPDEVFAQAQQALGLGYQAASQLVQAYVRQVFQIRHQRQDHLVLACRLDRSALTPEFGPRLAAAFNRVIIPMSWHVVESEETRYNWDECDRMLEWAEENELDVAAGPLVDFSSSQLPAWLWLWERDVPAMATFMCRYVEAAVRRYRSRIRRWNLSAASNWASVLSLSEDELMALTYRMGEAARQVDPSLELVIGISQPWGEYMASADRTYSPFIFADHLIRSGLNLSGLNIELVMGVQGRGSYCRDLLETSRLLDLYALLGVPLQVTLGYPSSARPDPEADPELTAGAGVWRTGYNPAVQAEWAAAFGELALCKPYVQSVAWTHFSDRETHQFPACGLIDRQGRPAPALGALEGLLGEHARREG
jgi:hypothetical protein